MAIPTGSAIERPPLLEVSLTAFTHSHNNLPGKYMNLAPLLRIPFYDVSGIWEKWSTHAERMIVYEHEADPEVTSTHCHFLMINVNVSVETLKREFRRQYSQYFEKTDGRELWAWVNKKKDIPDTGFITYMSKGVLSPKFVKNFSQEEVDTLRDKWVNPITKVVEVSAKPKKEVKEKVKTHWQIMTDIRAELSKIENFKLDVDPLTGQVVNMSSYKFDTLYKITVKHLNKNEVRTSRNELERFIVTLIRDDVNFRDDVRDSIKKNIFRNI